MNRHLKYLLEETGFQGYLVLSSDDHEFQVFEKIHEALFEALKLSREVPSLKDQIEVFRIGTMGQYHHTPGARQFWTCNWEKEIKELMYR